MSKVLVLDASYEEIDSALDRVLAEFPLDVGGKTVLLKPNILGPYAPESHVNTSPAIVKALVGRLRSAGATVTVSDNPGAHGYGAVDKSGKLSGIMEASMGAFESMSTPVETMRLPGKDLTVNVSRKVLDTDVLISLPKFKTHALTTISGAIKNSYGFIVGGEKTRLHKDFPNYRAFSEMLVDVYLFRVPDLVIMDGIVGMEGNGPSAKTLYNVGRILASDNGICLDSVMTHMMGLRPDRIPMLAHAHRRGLGEIDVSRIEVEGRAVPLKDFHAPGRAPQLMPGRLIQMFYPDLDKPRFRVDPEACNACGNCSDVCPGGAIFIEEKRPRWDYSNCVSCYCCMELCSQQAIESRDSLRVRIYKRLGLM
jgi:uncharacterized protein (DUF362 family)/Pyruvate/2-oxoacid:ferredoxin oxidoreductase delta subunit